jgi:hypothetical protein
MAELQSMTSPGGKNEYWERSGMADPGAVAELQTTSNQFDAIDLAKLLRKTLGEESLEMALQPRLERVRQFRDFGVKYAPTVHNEFVNQLRSQLQNIVTLLTQQSNRGNPEYISNKNQVLQQLDAYIEESRRFQPAFVSAAILERGFLEDEGIRREYQKTVEELRKETAETLATVKKEADKAIGDAKALADEIEARARKTATRISVEEAQRQFNAASKDFDSKVKTWAYVLAGSILILIGVPFGFMAWPLPQSDQWVVHLYHAILRLVVLSALAGFVAFSARMLRAHLHMAEKNRHRVRVANSVESFVNSALDPQQRDLILAKVVEAIVDFGDSGLLKHEAEEMASPVTSGEMMGRILAALSPKR